MKRRNFAFIDTETTGFDPIKNEIIEIGGLIVETIPQAGRGPALKVIDEFDYKIKPRRIETADPEALQINGYNEAEWLFAPDLKQVLESVVEKTAGANMVGQNVSFDWIFLQQALKEVGLESKMHYHRIDVMSMAFVKLYHDERAKHFNLSALCEYFGVTNERAHTALADAKATFEVFKKILGV